MSYQLHQGDCLETLRGMADNSVDSIVTDPPYGLAFMGKKWDYDVPKVEVWEECLRVLKPGGHLLAFAGTRTQHRMAVRIEDAGFEIRDMIAWVYGSGFPKSLDVSKAIDKAAGVAGGYGEKKANVHSRGDHVLHDGWKRPWQDNPDAVDKSGREYLPGSNTARQWQGWGTALKPALEPITMARKPLGSTVAECVLAHGTGALNIDGCRVAAEGEQNPSIERRAAAAISGKSGGCMDSALRAREGLPAWNKDVANYVAGNPGEALGRWPANLIHDGSPEVLAGFPETSVGGGDKSRKSVQETAVYSGGWGCPPPDIRAPETGSAARFFYTAKASSADRDEGLHGFDVQIAGSMRGNRATVGTPRTAGDGVTPVANPMRSNTHPTVKPTDLMRYLVRLVTPPGGTVLDPFNGSGSTGKACMLEGFAYIGCELDPAYIEISRARIEHAIALRASGAEKLHPASARDDKTIDLFSGANE